MKITAIKNIITDQYGYKYLHNITTKSYKNRKVVTETVSLNNQPIQKIVLDKGKVKVFDMGLFGWVERIRG